MEGYKLGALPRDFSRPAPSLTAYITNARSFGGDPLPRAGKRVDYESRVQTWPVYANDRIGDCTIAAMFHSVSAVTAYAGTVPGGAMFTTAEAIHAYSAVGGYDPATGANDNGATLADVCRYMVQCGAKDVQGKTRKLAAWAEVDDPTDLKLLKRVLNAFGTVYLAIQVPQSALQQAQSGQPWTPVQGSPIEGGHAIDLQYSAVGTGDWNDETVITWGKPQKMSEAFAREYIVEAVAVVPEDAVSPKTGLNAAGLNFRQLVNDCQTKYLV